MLSKRFGESTPASIAMHSPLVAERVVSAAAPACAVRADWVGSVLCLVDTSVGGVSSAIEVSSTIVTWLVSVVSVASVVGAVSIAVVAG